ncbi:fatty-acid amide hydrolase 2-B [Plutella xylostella]|uniref:fatty-acid amide hydrolase 2-B n=1 Tax=Plutella xylostella TaxID=51655 RepID=UPI0020324A0D|nr:fatty-acid amide hydrolase 2-B [Plutella xylostella]
MSTTVEIPDGPIGLHVKVLHYVRLVAALVARVLFNLFYGKSGEKLPPITEPILREPAVEIARRIRTQEVSSVEVLEAFIRRIKDVNSALNCFVEDRYELALKEAREADDLVKSGSLSVQQLEKDKPFLGVPFTTKDCIAVKGLHHTSGVVLRKDVIADQDAETVKLLREKGAIIMGLTNVPELCMWWETHNHIHGRTNNPYNTTRIVGGSSGGEGCIQAAAGSAFGVGSDIGGSIRMPSYFNGIFGHKPSKFIVSNAGQYPEPTSELHSSFLGIGPMVRHAVDMKPLLKIMSGSNSDKLKLDEPVDISKLKVFYQINNDAPITDPVDPEIAAAMEKVVEYLKVKHNIVAEKQRITRLRKSNPIWLTLMKDEKKSFAQRIMGKDGVCTLLLEMLKNFIGCSGNTLIGIVTGLVDRGGVAVGSEKYNHYLRCRDELIDTFQTMLGEDGVFLYPTHPTPAPYHNEPLVRPMNFCYTSIINCMGLPATNIPLGLGSEGLPIGIQVVANYNNDRLCLAVAEELDKAFGGWVEPHKA